MVIRNLTLYTRRIKKGDDDIVNSNISDSFVNSYFADFERAVRSFVLLEENRIDLQKTAVRLTEVKMDNKKIILAFMLFGDGLLKHYQIIPIGMVKSIKELR